MEMKEDDLTATIIRCAFKVHNTLGSGFAEKVYENALMIEIVNHGLEVKQQEPIKVYYGGKVVGDYFADLLVEGRVVIELKAVQSLSAQNETQLVNYLVATGIDTGLLINFGSSVQVKRKYRSYKPRKNPVNPDNPVNPV